MAINPIDDVPCDKTVTLSQSSLNHYKHGSSPASRLVKKDFSPEGSLSNLTYKFGKFKNNLEFKSPYLKNSNQPMLGDSVQLLSRVTEKRYIHKNGGNIMSSFPLAGDIYKANSDEFKARQTGKKVLKSVLTLPNNADTTPQLCTASDMNDSEYLNGRNDLCRKTRKRNLQCHMRKYRPHSKVLDLESQYLSSDMGFQLDCSSNDTIKNIGDGKRIHKSTAESKGKLKEKAKPHDVWAVLRNMNRFQFQTSPQLSEDSFIMGRQKMNPKRRNNRKDMRVFETRRTEEIAYVASYKVNNSPTLSRCSSFDKITVIDKKQDYKVGKEIEDKPKKKKTGKLLNPKAIKGVPKSKTPPSKRNNLKAITYVNQTNQKKNYNMYNTGKESSFVVCPNYGELKELLNNNASVDLGYESKTTENDEDFTSLDLNTTTTQASQYSQLSDNSGSSKAAAFTKRIIHKKVKPKPKLEPDKQINGITKVILSRGQHVQPLQQNKIEPPKINKRQTPLTPSCPFGPPKLTKTEINRQLHKYKFPVVILGKDQLRSSIQVVNPGYPQFDGLDQQIWPFMKNWYGIERPIKIIKKQINHNAHSKKTKIDETEKKTLSKNNVLKPTKIFEKVPIIEQQRAPIPLSELINSTTTQNQGKLRPIKQLKDRMLKLLYKNSSMISVIDGSPNLGTGKNENNENKNNNVLMVDITTDTQDKSDIKSPTAKDKKSTIQASIEKRPWAKAKWASDFIENVIKKIKCGTYYNHDGINKIFNETLSIDKKEVDIQTDYVDDDTPDAKADELVQQIAIPGFDEVLPALEIKSMSINEVAVKHCGTNIMVHFDITVPTNSIVSVKSDSSLIPIDITKSLTRVFKCQTSILNAVLPAELCSILPKMLRDIIDSGQHLTLFAAPIDMPSLTTISEVPVRSESVVDIPPLTPTIPNILPLMTMAPKLRQLLSNGYFKKDDNTTPKFRVLKNTSCLIKDERCLAEKLRPHIERILLFDIESQLIKPFKVTYQDKPNILPINKIKPIEQINTCTALLPYPVTNYRPMISMPRPFSLMNFFETMATYINNIGLSCFKMIKTKNNLAINMNMGKSLSTPDVMTVRIGNLKTDSFNYYSNCLASSQIIFLSDTDKILTASSQSTERVKSSTSNEKIDESNSRYRNKIRRKGYIKLYRKCKSASNVSGEKITPLNRITNLDDFFQVLGSAKLMSNVFDGQSGNKIMSSVNELKNWTTQINPRQALLVILLANKKETTSLMRYKPMLLQGIAVKRITKAIELDMEIEVIERENLNGMSREITRLITVTTHARSKEPLNCFIQLEGISYLPASIENQDSLYEELCWIAKNTASDYQRSFDHTSEKLLRNLLEKRKQLNPSYLRVMARYVGLGLLKSPGRRQ